MPVYASQSGHTSIGRGVSVPAWSLWVRYAERLISFSEDPLGFRLFAILKRDGQFLIDHFR